VPKIKEESRVFDFRKLNQFFNEERKENAQVKENEDEKYTTSKF